MADVVGVRFKTNGKIYYFDPGELELEINDQVVVETARGQELGQVAIDPKEVSADELDQPLKPVIRKAGEKDIQRVQEFEAKEQDAAAESTRLISELNLPMKLLSAEYNLDGSRLTIYFSATERVDFRELVRELAKRLKVRVEMRQTGPRDEARMVGGCGRCGRQLCCSSFLSEFAPVAMRMAKDQGLPLNPMKISGCCGRLMCCLVYENEQYREMKRLMPKNGQTVTTPSGEGRVISTNPLKETVLVEFEDQPPSELPLSEINAETRPQERQPQEKQPQGRNQQRK